MNQPAPPYIATTIKELRSARSLTLDQLAAASGISKSMLSQIERNKTNPTVGTLWNLTQALGIDIAELLGTGSKVRTSKSMILTMKAHQTPEIQSADGKCTLKILGPHNLVSHMEWYEVMLDKGGILDSDPHTENTIEHITVLDGSVTISTGDDTDILQKGDTARYAADVHHYIKNHTNARARAILIVYTPD
jgi:transcriptional regulator with XRE-family HTH domain